MIEEILLRDQTTGKNILWANSDKNEREEIKLEDIYLIRPRHEKIREHQKQRTRDRAEIFTPPDICKLQNDLIDEAWLKNFAIPWLKEKENLNENSLIDRIMLEEDFKKIFAVFFKTEPVNIDSIVALWLAENKKLWETYVDLPRLEITCGEAPYLVSRYNAVTGEPIEFDNRFGLLDRKLKLIKKENLKPIVDWTRRAVRSVYGYDFQGDNLFLARRNVFETVKDYYSEKFSLKPREDFLIEVAEIISWNLWQMNGRTNAIPYYEPPPKKTTGNPNQGTLGFGNEYEPEREPENVYCKIMNWTTGEPFEFITLTKGARR